MLARTHATLLALSIQMVVVFRNLFSNAIKFSTRGGKVVVYVRREVNEAGKETVTIAVQDSGAGLSKENIGRLFQEGVQFNANKLQKGGGSGLGLYITKGIVDLHTGARIWAESDGEGHGCTFSVEVRSFVACARSLLSVSFIPPRTRAVAIYADAHGQSRQLAHCGAIQRRLHAQQEEQLQGQQEEQPGRISPPPPLQWSLPRRSRHFARVR